MKNERGGSPAGAGAENQGIAPEWVAQFLSGLIVTGSVAEAVKEAGIDFETAWALRSAEPEFARYWDRAASAHRRIAAGVPFEEAVADDTESIH
jgi:hypothetical protein